MKRIINYSNIKIGQIGFVSSQSFDGKLIKDFEYPKDFAGLEVNHAWIMGDDIADTQWVSEEKTLTGIGNTKLDDYLCGNDLIIILERKIPLTTAEQNAVLNRIEQYTNEGFYRLNAIPTQAIRYMSEKLESWIGWPKHDWIVKFREKNGRFICSEWALFAIGDPNYRDKSPRDIQLNPDYVVSQIIMPIVKTV
jgi:hypothetical protein